MRRAACVLLLALAACSNRPGYALSQRPDDAPRVRDRGYYDLLERYTAFESGYDGLDHRYYLAATWESWTFRQRRVEAMSDFLSLPADDRRAHLARERAEARQFVDFFLGFYTAESRWNDLSSPRSIWRLELEFSDGSTTLPVEVERIHRPDATLKALYGYLAPFWVGYRVRFPWAEGLGPDSLRPGDTLRLRMSSAVGRAEPTWQVAPGDLPPAGANDGRSRETSPGGVGQPDDRG